MKLKTVINITRIVCVLNKMYTAAKKLDRRYILAVDWLYLHLLEGLAGVSVSTVELIHLQ